MQRRRSESSESRVPLWIVEGLDIAEQRRMVLVGVAVALSLVGALLSVFAPGIVPPRALVGAAVGVAALMLGYAAAVAVDAADLTVWGPRHVRAAGGEVVAIVPSEATLADARPLARAVLDARDGEERVLLGMAAAGREHRLVSDWSDVVATALAESGVSVLFVDLAAGRSDEPGLYEVVEQGLRIGSVADIDEDLLLARLGAGGDLAGALAAVRSLPERLPRDLDVLLLSLPTAASREVVEAASAALDHVLLVAERGTTARVDLIAALDALEGTGTSAQAVLADDRTVSRMTGRAATGAGTATSAFTAASGPTAPEAGGPLTDAQDEAAPPESPAAQPEVPDTDEADAATGIPGTREGLGAVPEASATAGPPEEPLAPAPDEPVDPAPGPVAAEPLVPAPDPVPDEPVAPAPDEPVAPAPEPRADDEVARDLGHDVAPAPEPEASEPDVSEPDASEADAPDPDGPAPGPSPADERDAATDRLVEARAPEVLGAARAELAAYRTERRAEPSETDAFEGRPGEDAASESPADGREADEEPHLTSTVPTPERARPPEQVPDLEPAEPAERAESAGPAPGVTPEEADTDAEDPLVTTAQLAILVDELEDRRGQDEPRDG